MRRDKPTTDEAAHVAIRKCAAPFDISTYKWIEAVDHGEEYQSVTDEASGKTILMVCYDTSADGTLGVGWNTALRTATYSWVPAEP